MEKKIMKKRVRFLDSEKRLYSRKQTLFFVMIFSFLLGENVEFEYKILPLAF
jgi:hypothetical protein